MVSKRKEVQCCSQSSYCMRYCQSQLLKYLLVLNLLIIAGSSCCELLICPFPTIPAETATTNSSSFCANTIDPQRLAGELEENSQAAVRAGTFAWRACRCG